MPRAHQCMVYLPTWTVDFYGINVGKYTIPGCYGMVKVFRISPFFPPTLKVSLTWILLNGGGLMVIFIMVQSV